MHQLEILITVAALRKNIERIKHFLGTSENAVKIQVLVAMIAYLLLRLVKNNLSLNKRSLQDIARLISANIFHRKSLFSLLAETTKKLKPDKSVRYIQNQLVFS